MPLTPMLFVTDVEASSRWHQAMLGAKSVHGGPEFDMLMGGAGEMMLFLHRADADAHGHRGVGDGALGSGVVFYVSVPDVHAAYAKAVEMGATVEGPPKFLKLAGQTEFTARDPDGYAVALYQRGEV